MKYSSTGKGVLQLPGQVRAAVVMQTPPLPTAPAVSSIEVSVVGHNHGGTTGTSQVQIVVLNHKKPTQILYRSVIANLLPQRTRFKRRFTLDASAQGQFRGNPVAILACAGGPPSACNVEAVSLSVTF